MHAAGYAHRDLKPENILLDNNFVLKISDFGLAAPIQGRNGEGLLETQLGTLSYMAPEIHLGNAYEGARVDIFASGIILFMILSQRAPFGVAKPSDRHYRMLAEGRFEDFWLAHAEVNNGTDIFSAEFKDLFQKMMSVIPTQRPTIEQILEHPWMQGEHAT